MKRKVSAKPDLVCGIAVYLPHQWERLLATAEDRDKLEGTWEEWHQVLEETERNLRSIGIEPVEIVLDLYEFEEYCAERNLKNSGGSRAEYVAQMLEKQSKQARGDK